MVKKKAEYVKVKLLKDFNPGKKGEIFQVNKKDVKGLIDNQIAEILSEKENRTKIVVGKETLKTTNLVNSNLSKTELKVLRIDKEIYPEILKELKKEENLNQKELIELKNPDLLNNIIKEVQLKVVGENESIKSIFLCSCGRLVEGNHIASYNLLVNSKSGTGKDFVTTATTELWNKTICIKRTRISPTAFTYWHDANLDPDWTWDGKILVLEDISENVLNSDVFKVMQSSGSMATIVVNNKAKDLEVKGKPVLIITTAKASPDIELIRRNSICQLDESRKQTREILKEQAIKAMEGIIEKPNNHLRKSLNELKRFKVKIPFANLFVDCFPNDLIMRTSFNRFIDLIKASAALHQFQREIDNDGFILAKGIDYDIAIEVLKHLNKEGHSISLTRDQQDILDIFYDDQFYSIEVIGSKIPLSDKWLRTQLDRLVEMGFLEVEGIRDKENHNRLIRHYKKMTNLEKIYLQKFDKLNKNGGNNT